jgi:hypothetical protein
VELPRLANLERHFSLRGGDTHRPSFRQKPTSWNSEWFQPIAGHRCAIACCMPNSKGAVLAFLFSCPHPMASRLIPPRVLDWLFTRIEKRIDALKRVRFTGDGTSGQ